MGQTCWYHVMKLLNVVETFLTPHILLYQPSLFHPSLGLSSCPLVRSNPSICPILRQMEVHSPDIPPWQVNAGNLNSQLGWLNIHCSLLSLQSCIHPLFLCLSVLLPVFPLLPRDATVCGRERYWHTRHHKRPCSSVLCYLSLGTVAATYLDTVNQISVTWLTHWLPK